MDHTISFKDAVSDMELKFTSGNSVQVTRTTITREAWNALQKEIQDLRNKVEKLRKENAELQSKLAPYEAFNKHYMDKHKKPFNFNYLRQEDVDKIEEG